MTTTELLPTYSINQRLVGYADNDGRFTAERVAPLRWVAGTLRMFGESGFLGIFDTRLEAEAAIAADLEAWEIPTGYGRPLH